MHLSYLLVRIPYNYLKPLKFKVALSQRGGCSNIQISILLSLSYSGLLTEHHSVTQHVRSTHSQVLSFIIESMNISLWPVPYRKMELSYQRYVGKNSQLTLNLLYLVTIYYFVFGRSGAHEFQVKTVRSISHGKLNVEMFIRTYSNCAYDSKNKNKA